MRKYRKGLIQTPEQLRFGFLAIIQGIKTILNLTLPLNKEVPLNKVEADDDSGPCGSKPPYNRSLGVPSDDESEAAPLLPSNGQEATPTDKPVVGSPTNNNLGAVELRRRAREERNKKTTEAIKKIKDKQKEIEERSRFKSQFYKFSCIGLLAIIGAGLAYSYLNPSTSFKPPSASWSLSF